MPGKRETFAATAIVLFFVVVTLLTVDIFGHVTIDEVCYSDPAVNLVMNGSFTSSAWYAQQKEEFWASNTPLHQLLLAAWLRVCGFGIVTIRAFSAVAVCLAGFLFWFFLRRSGFIARPVFGYLFILTYVTGYGMSLWMRLGRPDALCLLIASLFCLAWAAKRASLPLFLLGAASFWAGIHLTVWLVVCGIALLAVDFTAGQRRKFLAAAAGMVSGAAMLALLYWREGVFLSFASAVLPHTVLGRLGFGKQEVAGIVWPPRELLGIAAGDYSIWVLAPFMLLFAFLARHSGVKAWRTALWCALAMGGTCLAFYFLGVTPQYYSWMLFVPLTAATFSLADEASSHQRDRAKLAVVLLAVAACVLSASGIPRRILKVAAYGPLMPQEELEAKMTPLIGDANCIFADPKAYYAVKKPGRVVMTGMYASAMTEDEADACEAVIVPRQKIPDWVSERVSERKLEKIGAVADQGAGGKRPLRHWAGTPAPNMQRIDVVIFRKHDPKHE